MIQILSLQLLLLLVHLTQSEGFLMKHLNISAGHVYPLKCLPDDSNMKVSWKDLDRLPTGIEIRNKTLWFFPAQPSHSGNYSCTLRSTHRKGEWSVTFSISVLNKTCSSEPVVPFSFTRGASRSLRCEAEHITEVQQLYPNSQVTWMKDGRPLSCQETCNIYRFAHVKDSDRGQYTCLVNFTHNGSLYTAADIMKVDVSPGSVPQMPRVLKPQQEVHSVQIGSKHELNCRVFVGLDEEDKVDSNKPYWLWNNDFLDAEHFVTNSTCMTKDSTWYCDTNLTILRVKAEFLGIPFVCVVLNSKGKDSGTVILIQADQSALYSGIVLSVTFIVVVLGLVLFCFCKVDLVLAYRRFNPCLKPPSDGKMYDAYVSYLHVDDQSMTFALRILPKELEDRLGYRLFISGRDDLPGAAAPDVISEKIGKSRRLVLILTPQTFTKPVNGSKSGLLHENRSINNNKTEMYPCLSRSEVTNWAPYESRVGLYDALVKEGLQVILVQLGAEVDEAHLPESIRYIRRTQGLLRWKPCYSTKPNGKFWKQLQYRMPPVQKTSLSTVV